MPLPAIIATLVADSATADPPPPAVVGATRTLTKGATGCPELEGLLAVAMVLKEGLKEGDIDAAIFLPAQLRPHQTGHQRHGHRTLAVRRVSQAGLLAARRPRMLVDAERKFRRLRTA